jgi:large subunit ribosomal protein L3
MKDCLVGKKIGMTHVFSEAGKRCPVTVIEAELPKGKEPDTDKEEAASGEKKPAVDKAAKPAADQDLFKVGDFVDITGKSKGKGFQGGMKRWNWSGTPKSHGSMSHRRVGSIGASASPSRVLKGKHMPGHMGNRRVTLQNLQIIKLDKQNNLLAVRGAVPGHRNSQVIIKKAKKK